MTTSNERDTVGIVLVAPGAPPQDWVKKNRDRWERFRELKKDITAELKDWPSTVCTFETDRLVTGMRHQGGYRITEVGYSAFTHPTVEEAIERAIAQGAQRVIVVPTILTSGNLETEMDIPEAVTAVQERHPEIEIVYAKPPFDRDPEVALILSKVREYDTTSPSAPAKEDGLVPLSALQPGETGIMHDLVGGRSFICRLAALGFTPGAEVQMIQNFGHGPVIVSIRDTRIALGRREAAKVLLTPTRQSNGHHA